MTDELSALTSQEVLEDHIRLRERGELDADLERNYDPAVLILSGRRTLRGNDGIRRSAGLLGDVFDSDSYSVPVLVAGDRMGYAEWPHTDVAAASGTRRLLSRRGLEDSCPDVHHTVTSSEMSASALPDGERRRHDVRRAGDG